MKKEHTSHRYLQLVLALSALLALQTACTNDHLGLESGSNEIMDCIEREFPEQVSPTLENALENEQNSTLNTNSSSKQKRKDSELYKIAHFSSNKKISSNKKSSLFRKVITRLFRKKPKISSQNYYTFGDVENNDMQKKERYSPVIRRIPSQLTLADDDSKEEESDEELNEDRDLIW